ncbi:MAG: hypothetical protein A2W90_17590 [Bacteroidetes bacterium GWF2_42_66]|nr:MAG: hypothetical protein A2W92_16755 [Bacteroidetes bacterium GWA2_42_15]OFX98072.1 MAG: hypothetical protein A2W89_09080 [Bacteroidetes bacterium GWE2_42_39]OFY42455.1 MAG: hypothetical protein A2W90_17590 [Bacteroidetes bacterium GWF2_42_66]HBL74166.1 hypothetical protein [Prolixibacteraceae bacterium]HCR91652.1 hypothetical protein [Prolixibacteraceae bacterium]
MTDKRTYEQEEQIRRYVQNEMTGPERNAFERAMQKDPFLAEAVEGLSAFSSEEIFTDIAGLKTKIQTRESSNRKYIWYAAASVLLIVISTIFLFNPEEKTNPVLTENVQKQEITAPKEILPEPHGLQKNETEQAQKTVPEKRIKIVEEELEITDSEVGVVPIAMNSTQSSLNPDHAEQAKQKRSFDVTEALKTTKTDRAMKMVLAEASDQPDSAREKPLAQAVPITEQATAPVANEPAFFIADQKADTALDEVVVVGYGSQQKKSLTGSVSVSETQQRTDGKAIPHNGWEAYNEYLSNELQHPGIGSPKEKVVVRLSFVVDETGKPGSFKILHSTNEKYNQPAIEIIEDGPQWLPAVKNSIPESETVKLRLVFPAANQ